MYINVCYFDKLKKIYWQSLFLNISDKTFHQKFLYGKCASLLRYNLQMETFFRSICHIGKSSIIFVYTNDQSLILSVRHIAEGLGCFYGNAEFGLLLHLLGRIHVVEWYLNPRALFFISYQDIACSLLEVFIADAFWI